MRRLRREGEGFRGQATRCDSGRQTHHMDMAASPEDDATHDRRSHANLLELGGSAGDTRKGDNRQLWAYKFRLVDGRRGLGRGGEKRAQLDAPVAGAVATDPAQGAAQQGIGAVSISALVVQVADANLGQPLEELFVRRTFRQLPGALPSFMGGEKRASVEVREAAAVILFNRERVVILEEDSILGAPRKGAAEFVAGPL